MKTLIEVTQEDIDKGNNSNCDSCPLALAMSRHVNKEKFFVSAGPSAFIIMSKDNKALLYSSWQDVNFIVDTIIALKDNKDSVTPFSFEVDFDFTPFK